MATTTSESTDQVMAVLQQYQAAFNTNDAAAMNALFTTDASFVNFGGRLVIGRDALYQAQLVVFAPDGPLAGVRVTYTVEHLEFLDGSEAIVHARQRTADHDGTRDPMEAIFTLLVRRTDRRWRIRLGQNTPVA